ncbi:acyltransferase family protein [Gordonia jacobaea]|uniref:acyltransferase family protein n=1 Tax=Gordonia jacobaea TaxID=122202 RepID=UPI003D7523EB
MGKPSSVSEGVKPAPVARNPAVDTLRGIACILLVCTHVIGHDAQSGIQVDDDSAFRWFVDSAVYLRMPLFSFLAGLVYAWRPLDSLGAYPEFMGKKVRRLLIPYLVFVPLIGVVQTYLPGANNPPEGNVATWLLYSISPYWFLLSTFWIFAVVALLDSFKLLSRPEATLAAIAGLIVVNVLLPDAPTVLQAQNALTLSVFFLAGLATARFQFDSLRPAPLAALSVVFAALIAYTQFGVFGVLDYADSRSDLGGIAIGILFPVLFLAFRWQSRALAWIGVYSSGIFLLHSFAIGGTRAFLSKAGITSDGFQFFTLGVAGIFLSILGVIVLRKARVGRVMLGEKASPS